MGPSGQSCVANELVKEGINVLDIGGAVIDEELVSSEAEVSRNSVLMAKKTKMNVFGKDNQLT